MKKFSSILQLINYNFTYFLRRLFIIFLSILTQKRQISYLYIKIVSPKIIIFSENCCIIIDSIFSPMVLLHISMKRCTMIMNGECNINIILINVAKGNCTTGGSFYFQKEEYTHPMLNFSPHKIRKYFHLAYKQKCLRYVYRVSQEQPLNLSFNFFIQDS